MVAQQPVNLVNGKISEVVKEVAPHIKEWDEKQQFDPSILKNMAALNLLGVCIPEEYGGAGFDCGSNHLAVVKTGQAVPAIVRFRACGGPFRGRSRLTAP